MTNEKLRAALDKVTKLRALGARATTQAEGEAAYAKAEAIIAKYQIDESQIEVNDPQRTETVSGSDEPLWSGKARKSWISILASALARIHGCAVVSGSTAWGSAYSCRIAGRPSDVVIVRYLFAWLHVEIERLSEREEGRAAKNAFRLGAVTGAVRAIRAAQGEVAAPVAAPIPGGSSFAMVLSSRADESMGVFEAEFGKKIKNHKGPTTTDRSGAYGRGREAGERLAPKHGLGSGGKTLALGSGS